MDADETKSGTSLLDIANTALSQGRQIYQLANPQTLPNPPKPAPAPAPTTQVSTSPSWMKWAIGGGIGLLVVVVVAIAFGGRRSS